MNILEIQKALIRGKLMAIRWSGKGKCETWPVLTVKEAIIIMDYGKILEILCALTA